MTNIILHACVYTYVYVCMYVCLCVYVYVYVCMYVCMYVRMYVCTYVYSYVTMDYVHIHNRWLLMVNSGGDQQPYWSQLEPTSPTSMR